MAEHSLEEIASLQVSPEETREILRRLSAQEFGGDDVVTVGDISEVAHATPTLVARILAEVRTVRVEELFESRLTDYDERLKLQAEEIRHLKSRLVVQPERNPTRPQLSKEVDDGIAWERLRGFVRSDGPIESEQPEWKEYVESATTPATLDLHSLAGPILIGVVLFILILAMVLNR